MQMRMSVEGKTTLKWGMTDLCSRGRHFVPGVLDSDGAAVRGQEERALQLRHDPSGAPYVPVLHKGNGRTAPGTAAAAHIVVVVQVHAQAAEAGETVQERHDVVVLCD